MSSVPPTLDAHVRLLMGTLSAPETVTLSAPIDKRRSADSVGGTGRVLLPQGVRKPTHADASARRETSAADPRGAVLVSLQVSYRLAYSSTMLTPSQPWPGGGSRRPCYAFRRPCSAFKQS